MEFKLDEIVNIFKMIQTMDGYSIPLWLSFAIPLYYMAFKKLGGKADDVEKNWVDRIVDLTRLPKVESWILALSLLLFIVGIISLKVGQVQKEEVRKAGLAVKSYCLNKNKYSCPLKNLRENTKIDSCTLKELPDEYPSEFWIDKTISNDPTLVLLDSVAFFSIMKKSESLLDAYLSKDTISNKEPITYDHLFNLNNYFTIRLIEQLIADYPKKYSWVKMPKATKDTSYQRSYGIIKQ